ncbi:RNA polymerase sigma-70 factor [hydrothermal vent metagenome]|uniref:RNA polymerase sigma-70 factor n=1 Tax=hydrothermal vent metagenome TaxID=652676 RepID=A0A3B0W1U1_9ZZZZ
MIEKSDEELMLAFANNDETAFEQLYARHKDAIYRYFLRHLSNQSICQELTQDLWMKIINAKENYKVTAKFKTWLYTLAHNRLVDWYRRNNLEMKAFVANSQDNQDSNQVNGISNWNPEDELQTKRLSKELKLSISKLPFEQQEVFLLYQEASLSIPQIAEMLDESMEKIKSRYRYAVKKLRSSLENLR